MSVVLAYVFLLQVVLAGFAAERMAVAAFDGGPFALCMPSQGDSGGSPGPADADHAISCALCSFASLSPLVPLPATAGLPAGASALALYLRSDAVTEPVLRRHEPRSSQGPPTNA